MATLSSILAWRIPQRSLADHSPWGRKDLDTTERRHSIVQLEIIHCPTITSWCHVIAKIRIQTTNCQRDWKTLAKNHHYTFQCRKINLDIEIFNSGAASKIPFSSVQFSRSVVSDSLRPHESQHARPPSPSSTPGVHSDSRPSSLWCHPAISSLVIPFSCPQSLPASESFPMNQLFA